MSRIMMFFLLIVLLIGLLYFLSTIPREQPTRTIETAVSQTSGSGGDAH